MASIIITGKIFTSHSMSFQETNELEIQILENAKKHNIWVNMGKRIKKPDARYLFSEDDFLNNNCIPFEMTDSEDSEEADCILCGMWYNDFGCIVDFGNSLLPDVEMFLSMLLKNKLIQGAEISFDLAHGYQSSDYRELTIKAEDFCKTLKSLSAHYGVPTVKYNLTKPNIMR